MTNNHRPEEEDSTSTVRAKSPNVLRKIYLCVHALCWLEITPDDLRRQDPWWEEWPGRWELARGLDVQLQRKHQQLIREAREDEGIFFLPTGFDSNNELIELAREHFGPRCVVCRLENDTEHNREVLGVDFVRGIEEDRQQAIKNRGPNLTERELYAWEHSKAWAIDLDKQLAERGYTYDPATVEFIAFGENWVGCVATFPIHMGRAFGLTKPMERRFDLINPDWSPMLTKATPVERGLPMPENIRLFIFKTEENVGPTWGRYVAQYWEGLHGLMDPPHVVTVEFPPDSVTECDLFGWEIGRARGTLGNQYGREGYYYGHMVMNVGCGAHTPHYATLVMAEESLPIEDFRAALLAGKVSEKR